MRQPAMLLDRVFGFGPDLRTEAGRAARREVQSRGLPGQA